MINSRTQGSATVIIVIILTVAIIGSLGYVAWDNFFASKGKELQEIAATQPKSTNSEKPVVENQDKDYLVLTDWGIKFKLPKDSSEILAYKKTTSNQYGTFETYQLTTKRVEELGQQCAPDVSGEAIRLGSIGRQETRQDQYSSAFPANGNEPINGYYYYVSGGQSICSEEHTDWQSADIIMISELLSTPVALK